MTVATEKMRVAFVWTEFQENVLLSLMRAQGIERFDLLLLRGKIAAASRIARFAERVVVLPDLGICWRNVRKIRREVAALVDPVIPVQEYEVWVSNYALPYSRRLIFNRRCSRIHIFEEGCGCYVDAGWLCSVYGIRHALAVLLFQLSYLGYGGGINLLPLGKEKEAWGFFPGCFPSLKVPKRLIEHRFLEQVLEESVLDCSLRFSIEPGAALYLPLPFADTSFLDEETDYRINRETISGFLKENPAVKKLVWKPHPRAIMSNESARIERLSREFGIEIECVTERVNFENFILLASYQPPLQVFSSMSSSLFVAKALEHRGVQPVSVVSKTLLPLEKVSPQVYRFFDRIGMAIIN